MVDITVADIENVWRPLRESEKTTVPGKSADAWTRILADVADIEEKLNADPPTVTVGTVKSVMISMVVRVLKNPDSMRQLSKSVDDWSKSGTLDNSVSSGELYLTDYELKLLNPRAPQDIPDYGMYVVPLGGG